MRRPGSQLVRHTCVTVVAALVPLAASAQGTTPRSSGPMTVERIDSGFLIAPEVKVTRFDRRTSELAGVYAGWLGEQAFFIGGGGYWMANRTHDRNLAYGGLVVGVMPRTRGPVGFGVKALLGAGRATTVQTVTFFDDGRDGRDPHPLVIPVPSSVNVRVRNEFAVVEPDASVIFRLSKHVHLTAGAGYRYTGRERDRESRDRLNGASGSIALQIGS